MQTIKTIIGTGGIGSGIIFRLEGKHDLGRNESRMAHRVDQKDFCKQHIILNYVARLLKDLDSGIRVLPVGAVGDDETGAVLLNQMKTAGMDVRYVRILKKIPTLFSVCFQFPDLSGGNITEKDSASGQVTPSVIGQAEKEFRANRGRCLVLAAPEVPLASRIHLLDLGRKYGAFNTASFVSEEMKTVKKLGLIRKLDLLSINIDEAAMLAGIKASAGADKIVDACESAIRKINPALKLYITNGGEGSYGCEKGTVQFLPVLKVKVANTAGAGDASLGGLITATVLGQPFLGTEEPSAVRLARLVGGMSVTSADTINFATNLKTLRAFALQHKEGKII